MLWIELAVVLGMIVVGARLGGLGLGIMGGLGTAVLVFAFGEAAAEPPVDVMLMIAAVVTAAAGLQASGGMDYLVDLATRALRKRPSAVTFVAPMVAYAFTLFAGTGHVAYAILPVIAEVSRESGVRPERPLSISVIASQQAITASPISAATVAMLGLLPGHPSLGIILAVCIPATLIGCGMGAIMASRMGKDLSEDPEYLRRLSQGLLDAGGAAPAKKAPATARSVGAAAAKDPARTRPRLSVVFFLLAVITVVVLGSFPELRTWSDGGGKPRVLGMAPAIEMVMLGTAALIAVGCGANVEKMASGSVFRAGVQAVIAIFGIAWMGDTFFKGNLDQIQGPLQGVVTSHPWLFAVALFAMSILLYSQAATVRSLMPLGVQLGLPAGVLTGMFPAVNGYFFIPNYPTIVAAINFDRTGTTRIGKYVLNHSFMLPGLVATAGSVVAGLVLGKILM
ncbi:MAG TPA: anaerobic C4-dicarboxylate transporter [Anaeromyxobacteraceae bacterium]|nr:anaerobic C4-dicarboxylate transporter [Anaeromyxobacteraceae bacterium]